MIRGDGEWLGLADAFNTAALDGSWYGALASLAEACGSRSGQLVGFGTDSVTFNYWTGVEPDILAEFEAVGGGDPRINPRVRAGNAVAELTVLAEQDFLTEEESRSNDLYKWGWSRDLAFSCLSPLLRSPTSLVGLAVIRTGRQGHIRSDERALFASLAPHVRAAVRTHSLLEGQALALLTGTLEALSLAAFLCDARGRVVSATRSAEAHLDQGRLRVQHGRLVAVAEDDTASLQQGIAMAAAPLRKPGPPAQKTVVVQGEDAAEPLVVDVIALPPCAEDFVTRPRVAVVVRERRDEPANLTGALRSVWGLTDAEAEVALMLAQGRSSAEVAEVRDVSVGTVRVQTKSIYAKVGVRRQAELGARLQSLL